MEQVNTPQGENAATEHTPPLLVLSVGLSAMIHQQTYTRGGQISPIEQVVTPQGEKWCD
jgi:hypothetical protein